MMKYNCDTLRTYIHLFVKHCVVIGGYIVQVIRLVSSSKANKGSAKAKAKKKQSE